MRILHLVDSLERGGAERVVQHLTSEQKRRGHDVGVGCMYGAGPLAEPLLALGIPVVSFNKPAGPNPKTLAKIARWMRDAKVDWVHTHNPHIHHYGVLAARLTGARVVVNTLHGAYNFENLGRLGNAIYGLSGWATDWIATVSRHLDDYVRQMQLIPAKKLRVIYNGIDVTPFNSLKPAAGPPWRFGLIARMRAVKDHSTAMRAFAMVARQRKDCELDFLGDGPLREQLENEAAELGIASRVHFLGERDDVAGFLAGTHFFLLSSLSEGLPMSLLEGMSAARPVVATSVGGVPEIVETAGCGWLCPPRDPAALAAIMLRAIEAPNRLEMGQRGREFVEAHCSMETMAESYEKLFRAADGRGH